MSATPIEEGFALEADHDHTDVVALVGLTADVRMVGASHAP
ncbi:Hypothetical protein A7982_11110 [Minicystis rosea]|nr:Hypothetical protein A7982_11110 [Minicystis rosea]